MQTDTQIEVIYHIIAIAIWKVET